MPGPAYRRVLVKLSGEALTGRQDFGIDAETATRICSEIRDLRQLGVEVGLVVGGGNMFRGVNISGDGLDRVTADHMGMLATVMNAIALKSCLAELGVAAEAFSALAVPEVCETFTQRAAAAALAVGKVAIFAGGIGCPFFSTDTAAALRACELDCDAILKATQVDGIYSADPKADPSAERYSEITHDEVLAKGLKVMDAAAVALARDRGIPIVVFSIHQPGELLAVAHGRGRATIVTG